MGNVDVKIIGGYLNNIICMFVFNIKVVDILRGKYFVWNCYIL